MGSKEGFQLSGGTWHDLCYAKDAAEAGVGVMRLERGYSEKLTVIQNTVISEKWVDFRWILEDSSVIIDELNREVREREIKEESQIHGLLCGRDAIY